MRSVIAFSFIISIVLAPLAMATDTRVMTMGENGNVMKDEAGVRMWPQTLRMFPNLGVANIDTPGTIGMAGGHFAFDNFVIGTYLSSTGWASPDLPASFGGSLDEKISVIYARDLAGMPFGFSFDLFGESWDSTGASKASASGLGFRVGAGLTLMESLETTFRFGMLSFEQKDGTGATTFENEGGTSIMFGARWWMERSEMYTLVPHFSYEMMSGGRKPVTGGIGKMDRSVIELGIGNNMMFGENILFVHDIGIRLETISSDAGGGTEDDTNNLLPYFRAGMEAPLSQHFIFRWGGVREWMSMTDATGSDELNMSHSATRFYIGAGYARNNFTLDLNVDPGFFTRGPYLVTGAGAPWAFMVSTKYVWGE